MKQIETEGLATFRKTRWFCSLVVAFAGIAMPSSAVLAVPTAPLQFSGISIPVSPFSPWISGINNSGQIVGSYLATDSTWHGFIDKLSSNEQFDPSTFAEIITSGPWDPFPEESIMGFNDLGQITGLYHDPLTGSARAYIATPNASGLYDTDSFVTLSVPVSPFAPWISGINDSGQIVGSYLATDSTWHGFIDKLLSDEQFDPSTFAEIITPGPWDPFPEESIMGFNDLGQITGLYHDPLTGSARAYVASLESTTDVPEPSTLLLFGAGIIGIAAMRRRRRQGIGCSV